MMRCLAPWMNPSTPKTRKQNETMTKRNYVFLLECPRCKRTSSYGTSKHQETPHLNCGDCLLNDMEVVELKIISCKVVTAKD
jgi:hypothetical protein